MSLTKGIPVDYDTNPERFRANVKAVEQYGLSGDVHDEVAERVEIEKLTPVLDLGCGEGRLTHLLHAKTISAVAFDYSPTMLAAVPDPRVRGDATYLPFRESSFKSVAALYMLYHLDEPRQAIRESHRVLCPGGLFIACAPSRYNDPELAEILLPAVETFDAENGPELVAEFFTEVAIERWNAPLVYLPDRNALADYLKGRQLAPTELEKAMDKISTPLHLTKRGALIFGRKAD